MLASLASDIWAAGWQPTSSRPVTTVTVYNRTQERTEPLVALGAKAAKNLAEACKGDAVFTMLANDDAVKSVVYGDKGVLTHLPRGAVHISSSTISVSLSERLAVDHAGAGQRFIAAPVFGRPDVAAAGKLYVITAGEPDAIAAAGNLFDAIGQGTFNVSKTPKAANLVKLSGNFLIACVIEAIGEALALVSKGGVDRRQYINILTSSLFNAPVYKTYGGLLAERNFEPAGFAAPLGHKDIRLRRKALPPQDRRGSNHTRSFANRIECRPRNRRATPHAGAACATHRGWCCRATPLSVLSPFGPAAGTSAGPLILRFGGRACSRGPPPELC
jgi:3-hydroxyisobutyrate dehydrogenase-like beta-hydroxyacid dehydrogenase